MERAGMRVRGPQYLIACMLAFLCNISLHDGHFVLQVAQECLELYVCVHRRCF